MSYNPNGYNPYNNGYNRYPPVPPTGGYPMAPPPMPAPMYNQPPMGYGAYPPYYQRPPMYYNEDTFFVRIEYGVVPKKSTLKFRADFLFLGVFNYADYESDG
ncbi:hypothetical protein WR25_11922 [Diploscapter pachys]|uniref:Uncharacterized protein n=1 Tax=Diploscapter pachys TaxID=2018661 RepID=A0A2A2LSZ1_9BILA|nr:hypothetical protein WR25_11922 [Diploscapter pachys]